MTNYKKIAAELKDGARTVMTIANRTNLKHRTVKHVIELNSELERMLTENRTCPIRR